MMNLGATGLVKPTETPFGFGPVQDYFAGPCCGCHTHKPCGGGAVSRGIVSLAHLADFRVRVRLEPNQGKYGDSGACHCGPGLSHGGGRGRFPEMRASLGPVGDRPTAPAADTVSLTVTPLPLA